ncbi:phospholipase D-like domain-containing protein [Natronomonas pharaonis]|nr:phospholipase D-like domain-containing protein [Natronomonas pharaonis]
MPENGRLLVAMLVLAAAAVVALGGFPAGVVADGDAAAPDVGAGPNATLVEAFPSPVPRGDPGEFVAVRFDGPTDTTNWTLTDGHATAQLPNRTMSGTVAFSPEPGVARNYTDHRVEPVEGRLLLADDGDRLELRADGRAVSTARYRRAPDSKIRDFEAAAWRPLGATDHRPVSTHIDEATAFVLPDSPDLVEASLSGTENRLWLAGYTFGSDSIADTLVAAANRGVDVRLLLDGAPVGGMTDRQARLLDRLTAAGVDVRLLAGDHSRYRHHHPKYALADDRSLVTTENFKPAGTGGMSSRGWGVRLDDEATADELAAVFESDWSWRAATPWQEYRAGRSFVDGDPALGGFEKRHAPETVSVNSATVLTAPDNADDELVSMLDAAEERILIQQVRIDSRENRLLRAAVRAADRGVPVRIHLADSWYVEDDNAALAEWLTDRAATDDLPLDVRIDDPAGYDKIHTKGVVVDDTAVVGSLNWVRTAKAENREVLVALRGEPAADYYAAVFDDDWHGDDGASSRSVPAGILGAVAVGIAVALLVVRQFEFVGRNGTLTDWQW